MAYDDFIATRVRSEDLGADLREAGDAYEGRIASGFIYCDTLCIDENPEPARIGGRYSLIIGNSETVSDDLAKLERELYEFAKDEGYAE